MDSSSFVSKRLSPILAVVAIQVLLIRSVLSLNITNEYLNHKCLVSQGKYTPGSEYEKNLKSLIGYVTRGDFLDGFRQFSRGAGPDDFASIIFQCRGDSYGHKCRSCFDIALSGFRKRCPSYKGGLIWYDQCLLEISTIKNDGKIDYDNSFCMTNSKNMTSHPFKFTLKWLVLLSNLTTMATDKKNLNLGSPALYAAGKSRFGKEKMYGMVQCTKDLSPTACTECHSHFTIQFQDCWKYKRGGRVFGRSCSFRFEFYPFLTNSGPNI